MVDNSFESHVLRGAVDAFGSLPGVGGKSALRLVLHLLRREPEAIVAFADSIARLGTDLHYCPKCHNITERELCSVCANPQRDQAAVCVVETIRDLMAIEQTGQWRGVYHVLGGLISPIDGLGPSDLTIDSLVQRATDGAISEVVLALSTTMEGDTTNFYLLRQLKGFELKVSTLARGVSLGDEIQYADELTLGQAIINRRELNPEL